MATSILRSTKSLTASAYLSMFFLGVSLALIGAAARNIGLTPFQIGLMITVQNIGFMVSVSIAGALADSRSKPRILLVGSLILGLSLLTFYLTDLFWLNLLIMFLIGIGIGTYEGVTDAMLIDLHSRRVSRHININHFFVTFGSIIIVIYLTYLQMDWRIAVIQSAGVVLLLAGFFTLTRMEVRPTASEAYLERLKILTRDRTVIVFFLVTIMVVGVESGTVGILTTYLMDLRGFTQVTSKIGLTVFLVGMASGRLFVGFFGRQERTVQTLLSLFFLAILFFSTLYFFDLGGLTYPAIFLAGIALSALFPLVLALAGILYPKIAGTVLGTIKIAIPLGGIILPFLMSLLARAANFQLALLIFPATLLLGFLTLFLLAREKRWLERDALAETGPAD